MVTVLADESRPIAVSTSYSWWRIALIGAVMGFLYWGLSVLVGRFIVDPLFCGSSVNATACADSIGLAGNITSILVGAIGLFVLVAAKVLRPLVIVAATAVLLWGLASWTNGLSWSEVMLWSVLLYVLSYVSFSWISRYNQSGPVLIVVLVAVVVARIVLSL